MSRTLHANIVATLDDPFVPAVYFVEMQFDSGTVYLHTDIGTITWGGQDWIGTGSLGSIAPIEESDGTGSSGLEVSLSGIDSAFLDEARNQDYQDRPFALYFGVRDVITGEMVSDPTEFFYGYMSQMVITSGGGVSSISVKVEDEKVRWQEAPLKYYDDATLQTDYTGDTFFSFLKDMANLQLRWSNDIAVDLGQKGPR